MLGEGRKQRGEAATIDLPETECGAVLLCIHPEYLRSRVCRQRVREDRLLSRASPVAWSHELTPPRPTPCFGSC